MDNKAKIDMLYKLKKEVEKSDHQLLVAQINEVIRKIYKEKKVISFVGHFSSGKSSLINHLLGQDILPSSPVPTTSNAAQITISSNDSIIVNLEGQQYAVVDTYDEVKRVNTENSKIESVEINYKNDVLPLGLTLQDTPGIDATFQNHEQNTLKYLLTSDVIVYTVEYNHVESEKNFNELKRLNEMNVPVLFVINQIDKHNEDEIAFASFKQQIESNLKMWDIELNGLYFTSIYDHPLNQFIELKQQLLATSLVEDSYAQYFDRIESYITDEQLKFLQRQQQDILAELEIDESSVETAKFQAGEQAELSDELANLQNVETTNDFFIASIREILKNAYIIPFEIREEIKELLEVYSPDYKVGGLFGKEKKRNELRTQQMNIVLVQLNASIEKQVNFHIRTLYQHYSKYADPSFISEAERYCYQLTATDLTGIMKDQTVITNDYVLNYTDQLKKIIEQTVVKTNRPFIELFIQQMIPSAVTTNDNEKLIQLEKYEQIKQLIESLTTENYHHYYIHIDDSLDKLTDRSQVELTFDNKTETKQVVKKEVRKENIDLDEAIAKLKRYEPIAYFNDVTKRLSDQLERMDNDITRIVVFGAFSAGKSSLINAMLGEKVLVSSPNPTTAAITEISYGKVHRVKFKSIAMMLSELNRIGRPYQIEAETIDSWLLQFDRQKPELEHQYLKLVQAVKKNYPIYAQLMEDAAFKIIDEHQIDQYAAVDEHSAFVDKIYLQYEMDFLKGKVIIDSPGIGSTNMRHTNETTEIIADSDLLIYVSYYNHVFTESDKAFISYLNELQVLSDDSDTFYVINAIDLAKNNTEIEQVKQYFRSELDQLNIGSTLFELSSKQPEDDYFKHFMQAVEQFSTYDSRHQKILQLTSGIKQLDERAHEIIHHYSAAKQQELQDLKYYDSIQSGPFNDNDINQSLSLVTHELNEQLMFMKDRLKIQLYDIIKIYFNKRETDITGYNEAIIERMENELSMVPPRLNNRYNRGLQNITSVTRQTLNEHQIVIDIAPVKVIEWIKAFDVKLQPVKINVTAKSYNKKEAVGTLYDTIHQQTMTQIEELLTAYRIQVEKIIHLRTDELKQHLLSYNDQIHHDIEIKKQYQLNDDIVRQIKEAVQ